MTADGGGNGYDGSAPATVSPGWYPDPWHEDARRYWSGTQWTTLAFPDRTAGPRAGAAARAGEPDPFAAVEPAPPGIAYPPAWVGPEPQPVAPPDPYAPAPQPAAPSRSSWWPVLTAAAVIVALSLIVGLVVVRGSGRPAASTTPPTQPNAPALPSPAPSAPGPSAAPAQPSAQLARLGLRQRDVTAPVRVLPIAGGLQVNGEVTLDLCDGRYPSESDRVARVQVVGLEPDGSTRLSTEAVRYDSPDAVDQAWQEIQATAASCSATAPDTTIGPAPDSGWPDVAGVRRLAYTVRTLGLDGRTSDSVVVYLSRGNVLLGVYFPAPEGPQLTVAGQDTIPGIVALFEQRLAQLPPAGLTGPTSEPSPGQTA
ncbi:MAG TPA: DUF2510 domain-containing protein [Candidatus Nanopelagicales bacterium]|nr:DUF2510 domain-containing protein [Candidatus Nanopelagicales bacterium]